MLSRKEFDKIMDGDSHLENYPNKDNTLLGLNLINKYLPEDDVLTGADHDIIYSVGVDQLLEAGLTKEDAIELRNLNWMTQDDYLACFV